MKMIRVELPERASEAMILDALQASFPRFVTKYNHLQKFESITSTYIRLTLSEIVSDIETLVAEGIKNRMF